MGTTKDLSNLMDQEMGPGQGPFLVRICQDAGLLPKTKPGGWRSMKELTAEQLADFVIAVAGTRASGERNANGARGAIERFGALTTDWGDWEDGRGVRTLREDIAFFLSKYRYRLELGADNYAPNWILFINDSLGPWVEIRLGGGDGPEQTTLAYTGPEPYESESSVIESVIIYYRLIVFLEELLCGNDRLDPGQVDESEVA